MIMSYVLQDLFGWVSLTSPLEVIDCSTCTSGLQGGIFQTPCHQAAEALAMAAKAKSAAKAAEKEAKEAKDAKDAKEAKDAKDAKDTKELKNVSWMDFLC